MTLKRNAQHITIMEDIEFVSSLREAVNNASS